MWKILTVQIREKIYCSLISRGIFPDEQKGCRKRTRGKEDLLYLDQHILNESKMWRKYLAMTWIDYKKSSDMVSSSWILHCPKMYKISDQVVQKKAMQTWRVELTAGGKSLTEVKIQRGIFQGFALSPLLFVIAMMPLNHILRKYTAGYNLSKSQEKINHLMYIDDITHFAKKTKRNGNPNTDCENIQSRYRNGIWHRKMRYAFNEKWQTTHDGRSRTTKSSNQNSRRKENQ